MVDYTIAKVYIDEMVYSKDVTFDYTIPYDFQGKVKTGVRVIVPFGVGNKKRQGIVFETTSVSEFDKLKKIFAVLDEAPLLNSEMMDLAKFIKEKYFCTFFDAVKLMFPRGMDFKMYESYILNSEIESYNLENLDDTQKAIFKYISLKKDQVLKEKILNKFGPISIKCLDKLVELKLLTKSELQKRRVNDATIKMLRLSKGIDYSKKFTKKQEMIIEALSNKFEGMSQKELMYLTGVSTSVINTLIVKGAIECFDEETYRDPFVNRNFEKRKNNIVLTEEQENAYKSIISQYKENKYRVSLLYGITGSGKTAVFMKAIEKVISDGENVIVMVPEIALTSQMISIFKSRFGQEVAVLHSGLSKGERLDEYKRIKDGLAKVVVGTRSAVFAPFRSVGLIIMDEEQEQSYKSDTNPRYHARDIAKFRCYYHNSLLLLSSATPSIESFYFAKIGRYTLNSLKHRYGKAVLPCVSVVNMNEEVQNGNMSPFSSALVNRLKENLDKKKQSILLLNRRGYNTFVSCRICDEVVTCPKCSISMTYHFANGRLMCHYCGYSLKISDECPNCHEHKLRYMGVGTQKIEQDLLTLLPSARVLRMDTDTIVSRFSYEQNLRDFSEGKYDIMLGTQMVAKGLDFKDVTLVGVISADQSLYSDDFRSYERTFSLLTQVVGRAGRALDIGSAIIQTRTPENEVIKLAAKQDYESFYKTEIKMRKALLYPPFVSICVIVFSGTKENNVLNSASNFFNDIKSFSNEKYKTISLRAMGPSPALITKINNRFRYKIIIKFKNEKMFRALVNDAIESFGKNKENRGVNVLVDINPTAIL